MMSPMSSQPGVGQVTPLLASTRVHGMRFLRGKPCLLLFAPNWEAIGAAADVMKELRVREKRTHADSLDERKPFSAAIPLGTHIKHLCTLSQSS